ncbi:MAG: asparagine synthase (glutamine-hydrolyzing) [Actinomycetota bacterium]
MVGVLERDSSIDEAIVTRMTSALSHRGPDGRGCEVRDDEGIGLGHTRLAVIDLSDAAGQPMRDGAFSVAFNGEIYNHRELRNELSECGHRFLTASDTEVILKAYREWGIACLSRLRGMFAFALWDGRGRRLYLARDRLGVKPLYYSDLGGRVLFASEPKALLRHPSFARRLDLDALTAYLLLGYVPAPLSAFAGVRKLAPGHYAEISAPGRSREIAYWSLPIEPVPGGWQSEPNPEEELRRLMREAFSYRLVSDVPLGLLLSGGVDSSLVGCILAEDLGVRLRTFTMRFDEPARDEGPWAAAVAARLGARHTEFFCTRSDALRVAEQLPEIYDEPFSDPSAIPTVLLCRRIREHVKVALSGDGGDELFSGYRTYSHFRKLWAAASLVPPSLRAGVETSVRWLSPVVRGVEGLAHAPGLTEKLERAASVVGARDMASGYRRLVEIWSPREISKLVPESSVNDRPPDGIEEPNSAIDYAALTDLRTYLPDDLLAKVDRAAMSVGLEVREPMLDHILVEQSLGIPQSLKFANGTGKYILKNVLRRYLPTELVDRPKRGFSPPLRSWLMNDLRPLIDRHLSEAAVRRVELLNPSMVTAAVQELRSGRGSSRKVWNLLAFSMWHERWIAQQS